MVEGEVLADFVDCVSQNLATYVGRENRTPPVSDDREEICLADMAAFIVAHGAFRAARHDAPYQSHTLRMKCSA